MREHATCSATDEISRQPLSPSGLQASLPRAGLKMAGRVSKISVEKTVVDRRVLNSSLHSPICNIVTWAERPTTSASERHRPKSKYNED